MMAAAAYLCAVCCSSPSQEDLSIVPQPGAISLSGGWFRTDSAEFRANPMTCVNFVDDKSIPAEGYRLTVGRREITVNCSDEDGAFYAVQTLLQILTDKGLPCVRIEDAPRFPYRGFHLDVSRHFFLRRKFSFCWTRWPATR